MRLNPVSMGLIAILLWSSLAVLSFRLAHVPPLWLTGVLLLIGGLCGLPRFREWRIPLSTLMLGVYGLFGFHFCFFLAFRHAQAVEANLLIELWPLMIVLGTPLVFPDKRLNIHHGVAGFMGFAGTVLVVTKGELRLPEEFSVGHLYALGAAFIWTSYSLWTKKVAPFPTSAVGLFCMVSGVVSLACHAWLEPGYSPVSGDMPLLLVLGLGPMGIAFFLWDAALKRGDPRVLGALAYLIPLLSTLFLILAGNGGFTPLLAAAMVLIIGGAVWGSAKG